MAKKKKNKKIIQSEIENTLLTEAKQQLPADDDKLSVPVKSFPILASKKKKKQKITSYEFINKKELITKKSKNFEKLNSIINKVDKFTFRDLYLNPDAVYLFAVSGGVDSVAMLDIFTNLTANYPLMNICVAHYNHKLRNVSADKDQNFVAELCKKYNIPFYTETGNVKEYAETNGIGIEFAARILRYRFLERIAQKVQANYLVTAHTADDSVETFFINLFRGSGLTGLSGIPTKRILSRKLTLVRPLINLRKNELIDYAKSRNLNWCEDETNQLLQYTRNKIRLDILPKIEEHFSPSVINTINRAQKFIQGADAIVAKHVQRIMPNLIKDKSNGRFSVKLSVLSILDPFLQGEVIQKILANYFNLQFIPMQTIDRILELEDKPIGAVCEINKNYIALKDRDSLIFSRISKPVDVFIPIKKEGEYKINGKMLKLEKVKKKQVKFSDNPNIEFLDWDLIPSLLYIRSWRMGDTFKPLGMGGSMKISDFLTNNKISLIDKNSILLLSTKSEVIWICGMRLSETFKITENTTTFLKVEFVDESELKDYE